MNLKYKYKIQIQIQNLNTNSNTNKVRTQSELNLKPSYVDIKQHVLMPKYAVKKAPVSKVSQVKY